MTTTVEEKRLKNRVVESFSKSKNAQTKTMSKDIEVKSNHKYASLLGYKITSVTFQNKQYLVKANRYLLVIIFKYLIENNKIDLEKELPLKNTSTNERCLLNTKPYHKDGYKMGGMLILNSIHGLLYIACKLDSNAIQYSCFNLLGRYKIPPSSLVVEYSRERDKVPNKYKAKLKKQGYCLVDDSSVTNDLGLVGDNSQLSTENTVKQTEFNINYEDEYFFDLFDDEGEFIDDAEDFFDIEIKDE